jgi:hypothetical protein
MQFSPDIASEAAASQSLRPSLFSHIFYVTVAFTSRLLNSNTHCPHISHDVFWGF